MPIVFEDEEEYSEGLDVFTELMGSEVTAIGADSSASPVILSEQPRNLSTLGATASNLSPSPMDIDSTTDDMEVEESVISGVTITDITTRVPSARVTRPTVATAVPAKRLTVDVHDSAGLTSRSTPSSTLCQPPKRFHAAASGESHAPEQPKRSAFGTSLTPFIIAHDASVQSLLDACQLSWGTIYEIARGVTKGSWTWSSVTRVKVEQLRGANADAAPRVAAVIHGREPPRGPPAELWHEYDREQAAILENEGRGLGVGVKKTDESENGKWKDDWYGGRIQQAGRLVKAQGGFSIQLEKPEIRRSHRFSRFLGSRRILQVRVADDLIYKHGDDTRLLLYSNKFILCGRVFLPFHAKERSVYLLETNQDFGRTARREDGDDLRISLNDFINWHNPLYLNKHQPISKWSTRWALGLSTSVPTIEFFPEHIYEIPDIYVRPQDWEGKAPPEKVLTDGCGFINGAALTQIMRLMKYSSRPTAVQGRIGGSKGMWILHPDPSEQVSDGPAKIWIRPSQTKIKLGSSHALHKAQRIFDLLAPSRVTGPSHLSSQTVINLSFNGISHQTLKDLMTEGLKEEVRPFTEWDQPHSMILLWKAVEKTGSVTISKLRRLLAGQARALGLGQLHPLDDQSQEVDEDGDLDDSQFSTGFSHKRFSGQPHSLNEVVLELLQAGFHPLKSKLLFTKLDHIISQVLDDYVEKFHIPVMESCEAYIVPDPYGVLKEGQIHFRSSKPIIISFTGEQTDLITGKVLVSRNPTRLPSDVQKVEAVTHPKLSNYFDVVVFPIKGKQSLASFLGGGDYDGDIVMVNWHKPLVEQFKGSPLCKAPSDLFSFFEREVEHVKDFDRRVSELGDKQAQEAFQKILLLGLAETRVGLYSKFHDAAVYEYGYGSQKAIHLAYMFTTCLDASKTGLRVKLPEFEKDRKQWGSKKPWYESKREQNKKGGENGSEKPVLRRNSPPFILDDLVEEGENLKEKELRKYRDQDRTPEEKDTDLCKPWITAKTKAAEAKRNGIFGFSENLEDIEAHVNRAWEDFQRASAISAKPKPKSDKSSSPQDSSLFDKVASFFAQRPAFRGFVLFSDDDVQTLKASLASTKSESFAFSVTFHTLCTIKARAQHDGHITLAQQFAQCMTVPNIVTRVLSRARADGT